MNLQFRPKSPTQILYLIVSKRYPQENFLIQIPQVFSENGILNFVKRSPKDLFQLGRSFDYFEAFLKLDILIPVDFEVVYDDYIDAVKKYLSDNQQVKVLCIDANIQNVEIIIKKLNDLPNKAFFYFYNKTESFVLPSNVNLEDVIRSPFELIDKIKKNKEQIIESLSLLKNFSFSLENDHYAINDFFSFIPSHTNYFTLNQIVTNYWLDESKKDDTTKLTDDSSHALHNKDLFQRQNILVKQSKWIDTFSIISYKEGLVKSVNPHDSILCPAIIIAPYHNPQVKDIVSNKRLRFFDERKVDMKDLVKKIQREQTSNYIVVGETDELSDSNKALLHVSVRLIADKLRFLDKISYLHASFYNSPVFRLPLLGNSINKELSFFKPETFSSHNRISNRIKIKNTIHKLGNKMSEKLSPDFIDCIKNRNGQIVAISDLPIEWLNINGIPLCFTHDICRIPETPLGGVLSHFTSNNTFHFTIDENIYENILVIYGCDEPNFRIHRKRVEYFKKKLKFKSALCKSIDDVVKNVKKYVPKILIFDCHGSFDKDDLSTYLLIGNEKLTNEIIIEKEITSPIVFLSACGTAPNYGFFNSIAQGFFEAGALSVTTTFLPVDINTSSLLYVRLLHRLKDAIKLKVHKNWLSFISHLVRTSLIIEVLHNSIPEEKNDKNIDIKAKDKIVQKALLDVAVFNRRRDFYLNMDARINEISKKNNNSLIPEYLFYSHLGRGDLIYFAGWLNEKRRINGSIAEE